MFQKFMSEISCFALIACLFVVVSPALAEEPCAGAVPIELGSTLRGYAAPTVVELEVPASGILSLDASAPGAGSGEPRLDLACASERPSVIERSASHLVVAVDGPGTYHFLISSQDPRHSLVGFKLRSGFVSDVTVRHVVGEDGEDEEMIEIDGYSWTGDFYKDGEDEEMIEIDGLGWSPAPRGAGRTLHARLDQLCQSGDVDDHGDSFPCATFVSPGRSLPGEIYNGWGDDVDVFQFVLDDSGPSGLWTVAIETAGGVDTVGTLYDRSGQRLDGTDRGGETDNFRFVRTLKPGSYFVRVEGRGGAEGIYSLRVDASP